MAAHQTGRLTSEQLQKNLQESVRGMALLPDKVAQLEELAGEIRRTVPGIAGIDIQNFSAAQSENH